MKQGGQKNGVRDDLISGGLFNQTRTPPVNGLKNSGFANFTPGGRRRFQI
jgi:hypothetical protein